MDAIACAFYGIKPCTYRRKTRKFNQHDLLQQVLTQMASELPPASAEDITIVIDREEWSSFEMLKREFQVNLPKRSQQKYQAMVAMFLFDEHMIKAGLSTVISRAILFILGKSPPDMLPGIVPTVQALGLGNNNVTQLTGSLHSEFLSDIGLMPSNASINLNGDQPLTHSLGKAIDNLLGPSRQLFRKILLESTTTTIRAESDDLFALFSMTALNLHEAIGDPMVIICAAASSENMDLSVFKKSNDLEWIFKSKNSESTLKILEVGKLRVLGYELVFKKYHNVI
jgi:hypothetical protein